MLSRSQAKFLREKLESSRAPLFIHDDDPDGLCAYFMLHAVNNEGKGYMLKASPKLDARFVRKLEHVNFDCIFVLDIPQISEDFLEQLKKLKKVPIYWIDHHDPEAFTKIGAGKGISSNVKYYNPRIKDNQAYYPTTYMAYQVFSYGKKITGKAALADDINEVKSKIWIAMAGCIADWCMPSFVNKFHTFYPTLLAKNQKKDVGEALFNSKIGIIARIFDFIYKGGTSEVQKRIRILRQIKTPEEILEQKSSKGKYIYNIYSKINQAYLQHLRKANSKRSEDEILLYNYYDSKFSFTTSLATNLQYLHKDKVILITRESNEKMKCSLRAQFPIDKALKIALEGLEGYGGGHPNACGAVVASIDWQIFLSRFREEIKKAKDEFKQKNKLEKKQKTAKTTKIKTTNVKIAKVKTSGKKATQKANKTKIKTTNKLKNKNTQ